MKLKFKDRLKEAMAIRGLKQVDLSNLTGMGESNISQYCSGVRSPRGDALLDLAQVLHVDAAWLLGYDVPMTVEKDPYALTAVERSIIDIYRTLNTNGKERLLERVGEMLQVPKYNTPEANFETGGVIRQLSA
jgi:transcriptional regulator with XRE-family HTH domain